MYAGNTLTKFVMMIVVIISVSGLRAQDSTQRKCGTEIGYNDIIEYGGEVRERYENLERFTRQYIENLNRQGDKVGFDGARERDTDFLWRCDTAPPGRGDRDPRHRCQFRRGLVPALCEWITG